MTHVRALSKRAFGRSNGGGKVLLDVSAVHEWVCATRCTSKSSLQDFPVFQLQIGCRSDDLRAAKVFSPLFVVEINEPEND